MSNVIGETTSQRGKTILVIDHYKFNEFHRKLASGEVKWRCILPKCSAFLHTIGNAGDSVITISNLIHNHDKGPENIIQRHFVSGTAKRKAEEDICEKPTNIVQICVQGEHAELQVQDLERIYYSRRKNYPKL